MSYKAKLNTVLIISGPTASGKTALSIKLAKLYDGEIISADSAQIYKYMNIGTRKATEEEMEGIPHHLIDIKTPDEEFSVGEFKIMCEELIEDCFKRGKLPIICGGTGLYISSVLYNYNFETKKKEKANYNFVTIVLNKEREKLYNKINLGVDKMLEDGLIEEVKRLRKQYANVSSQITKTIGYKDFFPHLDGRETLEESTDKFKQATRNYAKRQITWFKHQWPNAIWLEAGKDKQNIEMIKRLLEA
ncbi:MAG: tRNA (adenosine(37)-N6)-dimethylallyltransferase MiaA [Firmicutes bacterium]|nr:tRNA (adenosine(37)-N6)-dimethylallyltransferase MiaA [Bacillota bacterium]